MLIETSAGEAIEPEEVGTDSDETESEVVKSTDPLDSIEDETARNLAKAERAKARREARKKDDETHVEPVVESTPFATKDDLKKLATNEAKKLVAPEVKDAWDELVAIPLGGFDPMDAESIAKNMQKRFVLHQTEQTKSDDPTKVFTSSPSIPLSGSGSNSSKPVEVKLPGYRESTPPEKWY